jgi:hypothetical protein
MPREDDIGAEKPTPTGVRVLRATNVEIPITERPVLSESDNGELLKLRSAFLAGEKLEPEQLNKMMMLSMGAAVRLQSNCGIC